VDESHERCTSAGIGQRDLDAAASRRKFRATLPTPRKHHALRWIDLDELTECGVATIDLDTNSPPRRGSIQADLACQRIILSGSMKKRNTTSGGAAIPSSRMIGSDFGVR
jgi:hypothetical protein